MYSEKTITRSQRIIIRIYAECEFWKEMSKLDFCRYCFQKMKERISFESVAIIILVLIALTTGLIEGAGPLSGIKFIAYGDHIRWQVDDSHQMTSANHIVRFERTV